MDMQFSGLSMNNNFYMAAKKFCGWLWLNVGTSFEGQGICTPDFLKCQCIDEMNRSLEQ